MQIQTHSPNTFTNIKSAA